MLYKMLQTRILDSRYKIGANLQTELSKNDENDENRIFLISTESIRNHSRIEKLMQKTISD